MPDDVEYAQPIPAGPSPGQPVATAVRHARVGVMRRVYGVILISAVLYLSYKAIEYLLVMLLVPYTPPPQMTSIPARLTAEVWETEPDRWLGSALAESPRAPLAHYHRIDGWFQHDRVNDCTRSGCHGLLPHAKQKEDRAFLNMHATSIHCGVCHLVSDTEPLPLTWYDLRSGRATNPPALIEAYAWLQSADGQQLAAQPTAGGQAHLVGLLRRAVRQSGGDPALRSLVDRVAGPRFSSQEFRLALEEVHTRLPQYFRGEYGAKLALRDPRSGRPILGHPGAGPEIEAYLKAAGTLSPEQRTAALDRIHSHRRPRTLDCTDCHSTASSLVALETVGYPAARVRSLQEGWIFSMIEHIRQGQPFTLPGFVSPDAGNPIPGQH